MGIEKKKNSYKRKGFTLVELMAVLIIVGILSFVAIKSVSSSIENAKKQKIDQSKKNVLIAAQMYVENNPDLLPKEIGDDRKIMLSLLRNANYLKDVVTDDKGQSCMEKSYVLVVKKNTEEYEYKTVLLCGDEKDPYEAATADKSPTIDISLDVATTDVSKAKFSFTIKDDYGIDGYTYTIYVNEKEEYASGSLEGKGKKEIKFTSQSLVKYINVTNYSSIYIKVNAVNKNRYSSEVKSAVIRNVADTVKPICVKSGKTVNGTTYYEGEATTDRDWVAKEDIDTENYPRIISVKCDDGAGSGCKREFFSKSWPNTTDIFGIKMDSITIEDNAVLVPGNTLAKANQEVCSSIHVNSDVKSPTVSLTVKNPSNKTTEKTKFTIEDTGTNGKPNSTYPEITITSSGKYVKNTGTVTNEVNENYQQAKGDESELWLNLKYYPQGIEYVLDFSDNLYLYKYTWETNPAYVEGASSDANIIKNISTKNPDGKEEIFVSDNEINNTYRNKEKGLLEKKSITIGFKSEGMRYGKLTVEDLAGNKTIIHIYANLDRTAPPVPNVKYMKGTTYAPTDASKSYNGGSLSDYNKREAWSTIKSVLVYVLEEQDDYYNESSPKQKYKNNADYKLSGWEKFEYKYFAQQTGTSRSGYTVNKYNYKDDGLDKENGEVKNVTAKTIDNIESVQGFFITDEGSHTYLMRSCDKAENCSAYANDYDYNNTNKKYIRIDTIPPSCELKIDYPNGDPLCVSNTSSTSSTCPSDKRKKGEQGWLGLKDNIETQTKVVSDSADAYRKMAVVYGICFDGETTNATTPDKEFASLCVGLGETTLFSKSYKKTSTDTYVNKTVPTVTEYNIVQPWHKYNYEINTTKAGAAGDNEPGIVEDIAGNKTNCKQSELFTVKIDYTRPTCTSSTTKVGGGTYNGEWLGPNNYDSVSGITPNPVGSGVEYKTSGNDNGTYQSGIWLAYSEYKTTYAKEINTVNATTNRYSDKCFDEDPNNNSSMPYGGNCRTKSTKLYAFDMAGNRSEYACPTQTIRIDLSGPECVVNAKTERVSNNITTRNFEYSSYGQYTGQWINGDYKVWVRSVCSDDTSTTNDDPRGFMAGIGCATDYSNEKSYGKISGKAFAQDKGAVSDSSSGYMYDSLGNKTVCPLFKQVRIDDEKPVCNTTRNSCDNTIDSPTITSSNCWNNGTNKVTVSSSCNDDKDSDSVQSGCDANPVEGDLYKAIKSKTYDKVAGGAFCRQDGGSIDYGSSGFVVDNVGNVSIECKKDYPVCIDDEKPECTEEKNEPSGWVNSGSSATNEANFPFFRATCNDFQGVGCIPSQTCFGKVYRADRNGVSLTDDNIAKDKVGNETKCPYYGQSITAYVQTSKPTCSIEWSNSNEKTVNYLGSEAGISIKYTCTGHSNTNGTPSSITTCGSSSTTTGTKTGIKDSTYTVNVEDAAGNTNTCSINTNTTSVYDVTRTSSCKSCCVYNGESHSCTTSKSCGKNGCPSTPDGYSYDDDDCWFTAGNSSASPPTSDDWGGTCDYKDEKESHCAACGTNGGFEHYEWNTNLSPYSDSKNYGYSYNSSNTKTLYTAGTSSSGQSGSGLNDATPTQCGMPSTPSCTMTCGPCYTLDSSSCTCKPANSNIPCASGTTLNVNTCSCDSTAPESPPEPPTPPSDPYHQTDVDYTACRVRGSSSYGTTWIHSINKNNNTSGCLNNGTCLNGRYDCVNYDCSPPGTIVTNVDTFRLINCADGWCQITEPTPWSSGKSRYTYPSVTGQYWIVDSCRKLPSESTCPPSMCPDP